jgi:hypothetical protein
MLQKEEVIAKLAPQLWGASAASQAFAVLDAASNDVLLDMLYADNGPRFECLLTGDLPPDMAHLAPYLAALKQGDGFANWAQGGWGQHWGIFLTSNLELPEVWRHLRTLTQVYDPEGKPLYFRFYDPRVLRVFLPTCDASQIEQFFGPVERFVLEGNTPEEGLIFSHKGGELIQERFGLGQAR